MKIPFSPPDITDQEVNAVSDALHSGWITTGPKTKLFEQKLASFCNTQKTVCLNSATACLEGVLRILGVGSGDEVIVPAYTYTATASVVCHVGAKPVIIDSTTDGFEMDYDQMADAITDKTKVIIPVDLAGIICNYERIFEVAKSKSALFQPKNEIQKSFGRVIVLADAAHAFGAVQNGLTCGQLADFTSFSFHAVKNLTTAEGGALTWQSLDGLDNDALYKEFMLYSLHGQNKDALAKNQLGAWEYDIVYPAFKCNMTDIMASIGLIQLQRYPSILARRKTIIEKYNNAFKNLDVSLLNHFSDTHSSSGHLYLVRLNGKDEHFRNSIIVKMAEKDIACNVHYKPLPMMTAYKRMGFDISDYPNAFNLYKNEITLPLHTCLTDEMVDYVINSFVGLLK